MGSEPFSHCLLASADAPCVYTAHEKLTTIFPCNFRIPLRLSSSRLPGVFMLARYSYLLIEKGCQENVASKLQVQPPFFQHMLYKIVHK
jgi:hypothetical protein